MDWLGILLESMFVYPWEFHAEMYKDNGFYCLKMVSCDHEDRDCNAPKVLKNKTEVPLLVVASAVHFDV